MTEGTGPETPETLEMPDAPPKKSGMAVGIAIACVVGRIVLCPVGIGVVGVIAAIAIPNFVEMQYRAKRAEVPANVDGIKTAELAYDAAFDTFIEESSFQPDSFPSKEVRSWGTSGFDTLGWGPDGEVRGSYKVSTISSTDFRVTGISDIDGDGVYATYTATKSINATLVTPSDIF